MSDTRALIEALLEQYGYKSYDMIPSEVPGEPSTPGPIQRSMGFHPLIAQAIAVLEAALQQASETTESAPAYGQSHATWLKRSMQLVDAFASVSAEDERLGTNTAQPLRKALRAHLSALAQQDSKRIDHLQSWASSGAGRGFKRDSFGFEWGDEAPDIRAFLDAAIAASASPRSKSV